MFENTIAAISTSLQDGAISIIRLSGDHAIEITQKIFDRNIMNAKSHTIHYGFIKDGEETVDEVMVSVMKSPRSFTTEDTVEINCHGGMLVMNRILQLVITNGARLAEPGEFTKRAFLNGRIDLSEAEAVMDVISSKNDMALKSSVGQLRGKVSEKVKQLRSDIIYEIAFIESALDDPEHISLDGYPEKLLIKVNSLIKIVDNLLQSADSGRIMKEGIKTVIVGKPNAGKSSLLNILAGEEKAIVTDIAGTTRDVLEENINLHGISLNVIDTAGIRDTEDTVEKIGVERARKAAMDADLIIYVVDASVPLDDNDQMIFEMIHDKKSVILLNKTDLPSVIKEDDLLEMTGKDSVMIRTSTKDATGIDLFENTVKDMFFTGKINPDHEVVITNMRHKEALLRTLESLKQVKKSIENHMPEDFYSIDLMSAYTSLGSIIGEEVSDDLVNEIFSKFCMGK